MSIQGVLAACFCLVALQSIGVHVHVSAAEQTALHASAFDNAFDHHQDHADRDIPLLEKLGVGVFKLFPPVIGTLGLLAAAHWLGLRLRFPVASSPAGRCRMRWRPLLRAPPSI